MLNQIDRSQINTYNSDEVENAVMFSYYNAAKEIGLYPNKKKKL